MILKPNDFLLYSTVTELAYRIGKDYYNNTHYVWCTEAFDAALQPGTSNPRTICSRFLDQIIKKDRHAVDIKNNKAGILKGANEKLKQGVITAEQQKEIQTIVAVSRDEDYYPIVLLIYKKAVKKRLIIVASADKARDTSIEYIIPDLQRNEFEMLRVRDILSGVVSPVEE